MDLVLEQESKVSSSPSLPPRVPPYSPNPQSSLRSHPSRPLLRRHADRQRDRNLFQFSGWRHRDLYRSKYFLQRADHKPSQRRTGRQLPDNHHSWSDEITSSGYSGTTSGRIASIYDSVAAGLCDEYRGRGYCGYFELFCGVEEREGAED